MLKYKYGVTVVRTQTRYQLVEVEAGDSREAEDKAERLAKQPGFWSGVQLSSEDEIQAVDHEILG